MIPEMSWVAKWNNMKNKMPGCYALHLIDNDEPKDMGDANPYYDDGDYDDKELDEFIVGDGEGEE